MSESISGIDVSFLEFTNLGNLKIRFVSFLSKQIKSTKFKSKYAEFASRYTYR